MKNNDVNKNICDLELTDNSQFVLPKGHFCGHNCSDGCRYWEPRKRDDLDRQWCNYYDTYYYPSDRQGCLSFKE